MTLDDPEDLTDARKSTMTEDHHEESQEFAQALETLEAEVKPDPEPGERVSGRVLSVGEEAIFVDLGTKAEAVIPVAELKERDGTLAVAVGDTVEAVVAGTEPSGAVRLRRRAGGGRAQISEELRQAFQLGIPIAGQVTGFNKGGIEVRVGALRCFCPLSQIDRKRVSDPVSWVGQKLDFKVIQLEEGSSRRRPDVVLSRRAVLEEEDRKRAEEARARFVPGAVLRGRVTSLTTYGAFVDLGGMEGMLHVSEIAYARLSHPSEVLQVAQDIEVKILKIEPPRGKERHERISLSRRALEQDPWQDVAARFPDGLETTGRVVRQESFGAFVELAPGVDGLVHISQLAGLAGRRLQHAREAVEIGQELPVRVLGVDAAKRRISLGLPGVAVDSSPAPARTRSEAPPRTRSEASPRTRSEAPPVPPHAPAGAVGDRPARPRRRREGKPRESREGRPQEHRSRHREPRERDARHSGGAEAEPAATTSVPTGSSGFGSMADFFERSSRRRG